MFKYTIARHVDSSHRPSIKAFLNRTNVVFKRLIGFSSSNTLKEGLLIFTKRYKGLSAKGGGLQVGIVLKWIVDFDSM